MVTRLHLHTLVDEVATVRRAIEQLDRLTILIGNSYGGEANTNVGYNNPNVTARLGR